MACSFNIEIACHSDIIDFIFVSTRQLLTAFVGKFRHDELLVFVMTNSEPLYPTPVEILNKTSANMDNCLDFV